MNRLLAIIEGKDEVIEAMEKQIGKLTRETQNLNTRLHEQQSTRDDKKLISLNVNVNPSNAL